MCRVFNLYNVPYNDVPYNSLNNILCAGDIIQVTVSPNFHLSIAKIILGIFGFFPIVIASSYSNFEQIMLAQAFRCVFRFTHGNERVLAISIDFDSSEFSSFHNCDNFAIDFNYIRNPIAPIETFDLKFI